MSTMGYVTTLTGAEDTASLSLDFEKQNYRVMEGGKLVSKQFSEFFSFARSTSGGRYNEKGLYESVPAGQPRFDYDPITKVLKGLLIEEQRTNLMNYSSMGSGSGWTAAQSRFFSNAGMAPDGTFTASLLENSVPTPSYIFKSVSLATTVPNTITFHVKPSTSMPFTVIVELASADGGNITFDSVAKTFIGNAGATKSYEEIGDGWIRVRMTLNTITRSAIAIYCGVAGTTNVQHSGYIWGFQIEVGSFPTTYIPTPAVFTSRASTATYFDKNGVMKLAGVNIPRDNAYEYIDDRLVPVGLMLEAAATNRIPRAGETMRISPWSVAGATMTFETGLDGGLTATKMTENAVSTVKELRQQLTIPVTVGAPCTLSVYVKPSGSDRQLRIGFGSNGPITGSAQAVFNLATRTVASVDNVTYNIQKLPDGWARYSITVVPTNAVSASFYFTLLVLGGAGYAGDGVSGCILYGPQIESGSVATSYIKAGGVFTSRASTATYIDSAGIIQTAANNVARDQAYGYDSSGVLRPIGLLLEGAATNLLSYSDNYVTGTAGTWSNSGPGTLPLLVTPNAANGTRGEGTMTLMARQDLGVKYLFKAITAGAGTIITRTQRIKAVGASPAGTCLTMRLQTESYANRVDAWFNVTTGVCAAQGIGDCEAIGVSMVKERDGVWLCTLTGKSGVGAWGSVAMSALDRAGTTDSTPASVCSLYIDTAQCEIGSSATSYIPTTTTTVTRAADVYSSTTSTRAADVSTSVAATRVNDSAPILDMTPWYNQIASSFKVEFTPGPIGVGTTNLAFYTRSSLAIANSLTIVRRGPDVTEAAGIISRPDGSVQMIASDKGSVKTGVRIKACISYKLNSAAFATQGKAPILDNTVELPTPDWLFIGNNGSNSQNLNGHIHSLQYYPIRLSDAQTQLLTS